MNDPRLRSMSLIEDLKIDVRIIAATNRNQCAESTSGRFQQKLVYRLSVFPMELPPLRKRMEDIPLLAEHFLSRFARLSGRPCPRVRRMFRNFNATTGPETFVNYSTH